MIGIRNMYVNSLACFRVKEGESEYFRIDSGVRQGFTMSLWLFKVYGRSDDGGESGNGEERSDISEGWKRVEIAWPLVCR